MLMEIGKFRGANRQEQMNITYQHSTESAACYKARPDNNDISLAFRLIATNDYAGRTIHPGEFAGSVTSTGFVRWSPQ